MTKALDQQLTPSWRYYATGWYAPQIGQHALNCKRELRIWLAITWDAKVAARWHGLQIERLSNNLLGCWLQSALFETSRCSHASGTHSVQKLQWHCCTWSTFEMAHMTNWGWRREPVHRLFREAFPTASELEPRTRLCRMRCRHSRAHRCQRCHDVVYLRPGHLRNRRL